MNKLKQIIDMLQDEKIIEEIIGFIQWAVDRGSITEKQREKSDLWITWLEKRAEQKTVSKTEPIIEGLTTEFQKQVSHLIASAINKEHEYNEDFVKWTANTLLNYAKQELEKQGKQKVAKFMTKSYITPNPEFFQWIYNRLVYQYHENPNMDYMRSLKERIEDMQEIVDVKANNILAKQNPTWSEEDENIYARIIRRYTDYEVLIIRTKEESVANKMLGAMTQEEIWLKSLKERMKGE